MAGGGTVAAVGVAAIGFLSALCAELDYKDVTVPFLQSLKETGYVEGQNVAVEYQYAENQIDRLPALAADLVSVIASSPIPPRLAGLRHGLTP